MTNENISNSTTTDEETELHLSHKRNHSEGSRIGHRRTPSMDGVAQMQQNGIRIKNQSLPRKVPSHKKRYSHRKMKLMDIDNDIEKCILYGKETTL